MFEELKRAGDDAANRKEFAAAVINYSLIINDESFAQHPKIANVFFNCGFCEFNCSKFKDALGFFRKALEKNPNYVKACFYSGQCLEHLGDYENAILMLRRAESMDSSLRETLATTIQRILAKAKVVQIEESVGQKLRAFVVKLPNVSQEDCTKLFVYLLERHFDGLEDAEQLIREVLESVNLKISEILTLPFHKIILFDILLRTIKKYYQKIVSNEVKSILQAFVLNLLGADHFDDDHIAFLVSLLPKSHVSILPEVEWLGSCQPRVAHSYFLYKRFDGPIGDYEFTQLLNTITSKHFFSFTEKTFNEYESFFVNLVQTNNPFVDSFLEAHIGSGSFDARQLFYWDLFRTRLGYSGSQLENETRLVALLRKEMCQSGYIKNSLQSIDENLKNKFLHSTLQTYKLILQSNTIVDQLTDKFEILKSNLEEVSEAIARSPEALNLMKQIELLLIYRITGKMSLDNRRLEEYTQGLKDPSSSFDDKLLILDLLVSNADCLRIVLQSGLLINTLELCQPKNALESLKIIQLIQLICLNTKEEKLKELRQKYCVDNKDAKGFEKLNEMMKNSESKFIDDAFLELTNFYDQLQTRGHFSRTLEVYFEDKKVDAISGPDDLCRLLLKILLAKKFYACLFYKPKLVELIHAKIKHSDHKSIEAKEAIYLPLAARIVSGLEISQIAYKDLTFFVDALSEGVKQSDFEMLLFESLLGLTRVTGEQPELWKRVWLINNIRLYVLEHLWNDNLMIQTSAVELFANCVCGGSENIDVFEKESDELRNSLLKRLAGMSLTLLEAIKTNSSLDAKIYGSPSYLFKLDIQLLGFLRDASETAKSIVDQELNVDRLRQTVKEKFNDPILQNEIMELIK